METSQTLLTCATVRSKVVSCHQFSLLSFSLSGYLMLSVNVMHAGVQFQFRTSGGLFNHQRFKAKTLTAGLKITAGQRSIITGQTSLLTGHFLTSSVIFTVHVFMPSARSSLFNVLSICDFKRLECLKREIIKAMSLNKFL
jgi:hypothetical protein